MYISDIDTNTKRAAKTALVYLLVSLFCALFGAVYELYSHEVYSFYMIYAFAFPLAGGTMPFLVISLTRVRRYPNSLSRNLYHSGIAALTVGCIICGVLDIYGTTNMIVIWYWIIGIALFFAGVIVYFLSLVLGNKKS